MDGAGLVPAHHSCSHRAPWVTVPALFSGGLLVASPEALPALPHLPRHSLHLTASRTAPSSVPFAHGSPRWGAPPNPGHCAPQASFWYLPPGHRLERSWGGGIHTAAEGRRAAS